MKSGLILQKWNVLSKYVTQLTNVVGSKSSAATSLKILVKDLIA